MKIINYFLLSLLAISFSNGQTPLAYDTATEKGQKAVRNMTAEEFRMVVVDHIVKSGHPLKIGSVQLHRMGDDVAVHLLKISARDGKLNAEQTKTALDMLEKAFERQEYTISRTNRKPLATVSLLRTLSQSVEDSATKNRIGSLLTSFEAKLRE